MEHAVISITTRHVIAPVDRKIFSGFVEHMGRCVYGGLVPSTYPEASSTDKCTKQNFRKDVIETFKGGAAAACALPRRQLHRQLQLDGRRRSEPQASSRAGVAKDGAQYLWDE